MHFQQLVHLLELQLVIGEQGDEPFLPLDSAFAALEVETRADLARDPGERVVDLARSRRETMSKLGTAASCANYS